MVFPTTKIVASLLVFAGCLLYFVFGSGWSPSSKLIIKGMIHKKQTVMVVRWESGEGFNSYERKRFVIDTQWPKENPEHTVTIRRTGEKRDASLDSDVRISAINLDNQDKILLKDLSSETVGTDDHGLLRFKKIGSEIKLTIKARHQIHLAFATNNYSGIVEIGINGKFKKYDLYTHNEEIQQRAIDYWLIDPNGGFTVIMPVPRYAIKTLVIESAGRKTPIHFKSVLLKYPYGIKNFASNLQNNQNIILKDLNEGIKKYWHAGRFIFQSIFAAISTWILFEVWWLVRRIGSLRGMILDDRRYIFWLFFGGAILGFSIWLIAFWPGVMSIDSLKVWRAASIPGLFIMDHPILNVIFYMYLKHIWNYIAIVPITQIVLSSLLVSYILFLLYRKGIRLTMLLPL